MLYKRFEEVSHAADLDEYQGLLLAIAAEMGFGLFSFSLMFRRPGGHFKGYMVNNAPTEFFEATIDLEDSMRDPVLTRLKRQHVPVVYDQTTYVQAGCGDLWEEQAVYGYKSGIAVALPLPGGHRFLIGFDGPDRLPSDGEKLTRLLGDLQLVAVHAQDAALRLMPKDPCDAPVLLTGRQLEVLHWVALGKTSWETSQILKLSERTVNTHLAAIFRKLDAGSKAHAVYRATSLGLI